MTRMKRSMTLWMIGGALAGAVPMVCSTPVLAQQGPEVKESNVPPAVLNTARMQVLDSKDVVYRKDGDQFIVNYTTPSNLRYRIRVTNEGNLVSPADLVPNQPDNAPKGEKREQARVAWLARVQQQMAAQNPGMPAAQPPASVQPPAQPPVAGQPAIPAPTTPVRRYPAAAAARGFAVL